VDGAAAFNFLEHQSSKSNHSTQWTSTTKTRQKERTKKGFCLRQKKRLDLSRDFSKPIKAKQNILLSTRLF